MAHLLMIESFIGGNAVILPQLLKDLGHTYIFLTKNTKIYNSSNNDKEHVVIMNAKEIVEVDTNSLIDVLDAVLSMKFDGVITTCDYYIDMVSDVAKALELPCPFPKMVKNVRYKHKLRQFLDDLSNPEYALAYEWQEVLRGANKIGYPVVLKPVDLASSAYVRLIQNESELKEAFDQLAAFSINWRDQKRNCTYLLEAYMDGNEVSVEAITYEGHTTIVGVTQKKLIGAPYFIEDGHMFPAVLSQDLEKEIFEHVIKALEVTEYNHGVSHTELKLTSKGPKIVEINPRCPGGHIVEIIELVNRIDMLKAFVTLSIGRKPEIKSVNTKITSACVQFLTPPRGGKVIGIEGMETLKNDKNIVSYQIENCIGKTLGDPIDNAGRIGRIITSDTKGYAAMRYANEAIERIKLIFE